MNKQEFNASRWRSNQGYTKTHGQPLIKTFYVVYRYSTCHPRLLVDKFTRIFIHIPSDGASYAQLPYKKIQIMFCINVQTFHKTVFNARELERGFRVREHVGLLPYEL